MQLGVFPMDTVDRIFELADKKFKEQKDFAAALGLIPQRVSAWRRRTSASYTKYLPQIADALGTTTEYLLTGNGPKHKRAVSESDTKPDWLIKFEELSPGAQKEVIAFIEFKRGQE